MATRQGRKSNRAVSLNRGAAREVVRGLRASPTRVTVTVTNTGRRPGAAAPQLYLTFPPSAGEPPGQLRGFAQAQLQPGESAEVRFPLRAQVARPTAAAPKLATEGVGWRRALHAGGRGARRQPSFA